MIFHTQLITKYSGFHLKALDSTDSVLNKILPLFLVKDYETIKLKEDLASLRPDPA